MTSVEASAPEQVDLRRAHAADTRQRILRAVATILERGEEPTFALVAAGVGCRERTVYRHFPDKGALAGAFWEWHFSVVGPRDRSAASLGDLLALVRRAFAAFDAQRPLVTAMLHTEHGRAARLSEQQARREMVHRVVDAELPGLDRRTRHRVAAATHLMFSPVAWELLRDHWGLDGPAAAETMGMALTAMYRGVARRPAAAPTRKRTKR